VDRPFRPGDRIRLATGETGEVIEIGIRSTRIRLLDLNLLVVPNTELTNSRIVNFAGPTRVGTGSVELRVPHGADLGRVEAILLDAAVADAAVARDPAASVTLRRLGDSGLELVLGFAVGDYVDVARVEDRLRRGVLTRLRAASIAIASDRMDVRVEERAPA
jgi:MscS family membrane protein